MQYVEYVHTNYGQHSCIVFDGYEKGPSTKDQRAGKMCAEIQLSESMEALITQKNFLFNRSQFITLLSYYLKVDDQSVHQSAGDADTMIVACAIQYAIQGTKVTVVADDTDVLVLLINVSLEERDGRYLFFMRNKQATEKTLEGKRYHQ